MVIDFDFESFTIFLRLYEQNASRFTSGGSELTLARLWCVSFSLSVSTHVIHSKWVPYNKWSLSKAVFETIFFLSPDATKFVLLSYERITSDSNIYS